MAAHVFPTNGVSLSANRISPSLSRSLSLSTNFVCPFVGSCVSGEFTGLKMRTASQNPSFSNSNAKRCVVTMVIPFTEGRGTNKIPPDLAEYFRMERIVYLGLPLVPAVTARIVAELLAFAPDDDDTPVYMYINSTGTTQGGQMLGYDTDAFVLYDVMRFVKAPIYTLCIGNAWGGAALLLAAGAPGHRFALPSAKIMIKQPFGRYQGQAADLESAGNVIRDRKAQMVKLYALHMGKSPEQIEADIRRPKYFTPSEAVEYGIIDEVIYNARALKKADPKNANLF